MFTSTDFTNENCLKIQQATIAHLQFTTTSNPPFLTLALHIDTTYSVNIAYIQT